LDFTVRRRIADAGGWLLLAAGAAFVLAAALDWQDVYEDASRWQDKAAQWEKRAGHGAAAAGGSEELRPQIEAAAKALTRLAISWGALYRCLEDNADDSVSLLAVLPSADKGEIRVNGEAKDFAALRAYLQRLGNSGVLTDVRLLTQEVRESDAQKPIVFSVVAAWRIKS
jgi:hypothetical protein